MQPQTKIRSRGVIIHEGKLLLMRHMHVDGPVPHYALPGGHLDKGEDPEVGMRRELLEELGVVAEVGRLLFVHMLQREGELYAVEFFFEITNGADFLGHAENEKSHGHEIAEVRWIEPGEDVPLLPKSFAKHFHEGTTYSDSVRFLV